MSVDRDRLRELARRTNVHQGRYRNITRTPAHGLKDFLRWQVSPGKRFPPGRRYPLQRPPAQWLAHPPAVPQLVWIGHSTFLFQYRGRTVLTDPVFSERASPFAFVGPRRYTPPALGLDELPPVDLVLISHNHYDHLDEASVLGLHRRFGAGLRFCVPEGLGGWFRRRGIDNLIELNWWRSAPLGDRAEAFCVPAQHFSGRGPFDANLSLWCGWILQIADFRLYFAGDTGYGPVFRDIGDVFAPLDLALLPIGAYDPRWFMSGVHVAPEEAVQIHRDVGARHSVGMHWGTFVLTDEPMDEPPRRLHQALVEQGVDPRTFRVLPHGGVWHGPEPATLAATAGAAASESRA